MDGATPVQDYNWWCLQFNAEDILEPGSESSQTCSTRARKPWERNKKRDIQERK
jgi:hypothetical protein